MAGNEFVELTPEQIAQIDALSCNMFHQEPFDLAWCETHDTTFALGDNCRYNTQAVTTLRPGGERVPLLRTHERCMDTKTETLPRTQVADAIFQPSAAAIEAAAKALDDPSFERTN